MARTKADRLPAKAVGAKAPHKVSSTKTVGAKKTGNNKGKNYSGGNPYHPRKTPDWQKPITNFMNESINQANDIVPTSNINDNKENQNDTLIVDD